MSNDSMTQTSPFAAHAAELRRLAGLLDVVTDAHNFLATQDIHVSFGPNHTRTDEAEIERVDAIARLLNLDPPTRNQSTNLTYYETRSDNAAPVRYRVYAYLTDEPTELERLRAENERLRAQVAGSGVPA